LDDFLIALIALRLSQPEQPAMFGRADIQPIGLDIGHDSVKLLQLQANGNMVAVRAAASSAIESDPTKKSEASLDAAMAVVGRLMQNGGFAGRRVIASLPREIVHIKNLRLPLIPANELAAAIRFEARNIFPFDAETAHVEYVAAGEVRHGTDARLEVIVLAARMAEVDAFVERLDRLGLVVDSLDAEPCAIYRSVERFIRRRDDEQEVNVLLDVGLRRTQVLIGRGRELSFFKPVDIGGQRLNEAVARKLGVTVEEARALRRRTGAAMDADGAGDDSVRKAVFDATRGTMEELGREISLCLRYYSVTFRGPGPQRVRLLGGEAQDPNLGAVLGSVLSIPAEAAAPLSNLDCSAMKAPDREGAVTQWSTALGLALKKMTGRFAAKDGKPRVNRGGIGEVIDLNQAVAGSDPAVSGQEAVNA
jgi:type IV pilus assembly protein PilM